MSRGVAFCVQLVRGSLLVFEPYIFECTTLRRPRQPLRGFTPVPLSSSNVVTRGGSASGSLATRFDRQDAVRTNTALRSSALAATQADGRHSCAEPVRRLGEAHRTVSTPHTSPYRAALSRSVAARRRQRRPCGMGSEPRMAPWPRLARDRISHLLSSCPTTNTTSWAERARTEPVRMPSRASVPAQLAAEAARFRPARCRAAYAALSASIATMLIASAQPGRSHRWSHRGAR